MILPSLARRGWLGPLAGLSRQIAPTLRTYVLASGLRSGILAELGRRPGTAPQLAPRLGVRPDMVPALAAWLDVAVQAGVARRRDDVYSLTRSARALVRPGNDPVAAFYEELAGLDHLLVMAGPERMRSGERLAISDADPAVVARSSRLAEPWIEAALEAWVPTDRPVRLVEIGCGTGAHVRAAARLNPQLTAVALELQDEAAELARRNLADWGLADRVEVRTGDVRDLTGTADADLATLHQNIYYFPEEEQAELLRHVAGFLAPGGRVLVTTVVRGGGVGTATLDLWGALTAGASRLPTPDELAARLREAGYADVECRRLGPDGMYYAATGVRPA